VEEDVRQPGSDQVPPNAGWLAEAGVAQRGRRLGTTRPRSSRYRDSLR
jgi:hypothetical protein